MEKAKAAVSDLLGRAGHHDSSAHEQAAPQHENVTGNVGKDLRQDQQMPDTTQGNMPQGNMGQGNMPQGNMDQGNMPQDQTQGHQQHHHHHTTGETTGSTTSNTGGYADRRPDDQHQHADRGDVGQGNMMGSSTQGGVVSEQSQDNNLTSNRDDRTETNRREDDSGYAKGVVEGVSGDGENNLAHLKNESGELPRALTEKVSKAVPHSELHPEGEQAQGDQARGDRAQGDQVQGDRAQGMQSQGEQAQGMQARDNNAADSTTQAT